MTTLAHANYTMVDTLGTLRAMIGFVAILFCPGYVVGWASDLFGFRSRGLLERVAWGIGLSFGTVAILTRLLGQVTGLGGVEAALWGTVAATVALLLFEGKRLRMEWTRPVALLGLFLALGAAVVVAELMDIQWGGGLWLSVTVLDQSYRVGFIEAVARTGIPPSNPFYSPGAAQPLRYYYFWYALCAVCMKMAHVSARQTLIASSVWSGLGLTAVIALFARHFLAVRQGLHRYILSAALLMTVTGADIVPVLFNFFFQHRLEGDLEWWSAGQVTSWMDTILWVPNHLSALLACLISFLLLWRTREDVSQRQKMAATVLAGMAAASSFGASIYVAAGFAMLMVAWSVRLMVRGRELSQAGRNLAAASLTVALLIPYLREMLGAHSGTERGAATGPGHLLRFSVREMIDPRGITGLPMLAKLDAAHPVLLGQAVRLLLLIPGYVVELGVYGAVLVLLIRLRKTLDEPRKTALFFAFWGLVIVSVIRSAVIGNNDFGYRAALVPCFFLLLMTPEVFAWLRERSKGGRSGFGLKTMRRLIVLGVAGTLFQAVMLRFFVPLSERTGSAAMAGLAEAALEARRTYDSLQGAIPANAVVQADPTNPADYFFFVDMLYSGRQMATDAGQDCGAVFGGDITHCAVSQQAIRTLFAQPAPSAEEAVRTCRQTGVGLLAVSRADPAWKDQSGWVWTLPLVRPASDDPGPGTSFRVVNCEGSLNAPRL